jgi:hypothetical protein
MPRDRGYRGVLNCRQARHRHRIARKTDKPTLHTADGIWGSPPNHQGSFPDNDSGVAPIQNLGIRRQYHKRVYLGNGHTARI